MIAFPASLLILNGKSADNLPCVMSLQSYAMKAWKSMFALPGKKRRPTLR